MKFFESEAWREWKEDLDEFKFKGIIRGWSPWSLLYLTRKKWQKIQNTQCDIFT